MYDDHRELHVLTHSFPTRRSSDLIEGGFRRNGEAARHRVAVVNCCVCFDRIVDLLVESRRSQPLVTAHIPFTTDVRVPQFTILQERVAAIRSEEHTSELQSLMRISYAVFCLNKKKQQKNKL